ncbi:MAG: hypothetical protein ACRDQ9_13600 [Pseudonocardiaceae bacterium]
MRVVFVQVCEVLVIWAEDRIALHVVRGVKCQSPRICVITENSHGIRQVMLRQNDKVVIGLESVPLRLRREYQPLAELHALLVVADLVEVPHLSERHPARLKIGCGS